jgi:hypothetical protein
MIDVPFPVDTEELENERDITENTRMENQNLPLNELTLEEKALKDLGFLSLDMNKALEAEKHPSCTADFDPSDELIRAHRYLLAKLYYAKILLRETNANPSLRRKAEIFIDAARLIFHKSHTNPGRKGTLFIQQNMVDGEEYARSIIHIPSGENIGTIVYSRRGRLTHTMGFQDLLPLDQSVTIRNTTYGSLTSTRNARENHRANWFGYRF